jgi:hypothetical protein
MADDHLIFPGTILREQLESLLREEEDLRFRLIAMSSDPETRNNTFAFESTLLTAGEEELLSLEVVPEVQTEAQGEEFRASFEQFGGEVAAAAMLCIENQFSYVIAYRGAGPEWPRPHEPVPEKDPEPEITAPIPAHAQPVFGSRRDGVFGGLPWAQARQQVMRLQGLFSPVHTFHGPNGEVLAFLVVTDADIDTDGPGGSKQKDPSWQPETSLKHRNGVSCNSRTFPGVVRTARFRDLFGLKLGDFALVCHDGKVQACQVYDQGQIDKIGEISLFAARQLGGVPPTMDERTAARAGNFTRNLVTLFFPRSSDTNRALTDPAAIEQQALRCFEMLTRRSGEESEQVTPSHPEILATGVADPLQPTIFSREHWRARLPRKSPFATARAEGIVLHNTEDPNRAPLDGDAELKLAFALSRSIQNFHMDKRGWQDVGQHFTISRGGVIMEGRHGSLAAARNGQVVQAAHAGSERHNRHWFGIELEGDFCSSFAITAPQRNAMIDLCRWLRSVADIPEGNIIGHKQVRDTDCPGTLFPRLAEIREEVEARLHT